MPSTGWKSSIIVRLGGRGEYNDLQTNTFFGHEKNTPPDKWHFYNQRKSCRFNDYTIWVRGK